MQPQQQQVSDQHKSPVLIVDDSKVIRLALSKILRKNFEVIQAVDGEDAWDKLIENSAITAVFSDVSMPNLDGFGLLERVRNSSDDHIQNIPYIIITANDDDPQFEEKVSSAGGDALITKPFKTDEITNCVNKFFSVNEEAGPAAPGLSDQAVAEILGFDNEDQATVPEQEKITQHPVAQEEVPLVEPELMPAVNEMHGETGEIEATEVKEPGFEFTIDEDFLNNELDTFELEIDEDFDAVDGSVTSEPMAEPAGNDEKDDEISLTFELPDESNLEYAETIASEAVAPETGETASYDKKLGIEQARKRAMDIAREQAERSQQDIENDKKARDSERNEIRRRLEELRARESETSKITDSNKSLFFKKFMYIITGAFLRNKK